VRETDISGLAVALRYEQPNAPRVIAKGRGADGQAIIAAAREHGVPLEHNPPLALALSQIELDAAIPEELYRAVATVIAFVLRAANQPSPDPPTRLPAPPR
jgi:flagellar biosynthesis protein